MKRLGDWTPDITPYDNAIYYYDKGLFSDEWYFHRRFTEFPSSLLSSKFDRDVLVLGITKNRFLDNLFYHYLDTTPPPTPPKNIKVDFYPKFDEVHLITYHDPKTGKKIQQNTYRPNGSISTICEYDPQSGNHTKTTIYNPDGTIKTSTNY
ncbi:MAG: hypothetical protein U9532_00775 ['Conium maculatum' witches'-broom phytoplasma]|nr:hypothetical protein ['Conium maculatum' witches'-broom phytoplasma]